jgi:co-chaperonin GroES (HSP10)
MAAVAVTDEARAYEPTPAQMNVWFPEVDPGMRPTGSRVLVQVKRALKTTRSGFILTDDTKDAEQDNTQIALVLAVGPLAYRKRDTLEEWVEGSWCRPGMIVRIPRFGQHEGYKMKDKDGEDVEFRIFDDFQIVGLVTTNPDQFRAYL